VRYWEDYYLKLDLSLDYQLLQKTDFRGYVKKQPFCIILRLVDPFTKDSFMIFTYYKPKRYKVMR
jgi:hypothetical protein